MANDSKIIELKNIPEIGLLRVKQILQLIPISRSSWWAGVKKGIYPQPFKLSSRTTVWRTQDIVALINREYEKK
jgi:prophage regulatory protein